MYVKVFTLLSFSILHHSLHALSYYRFFSSSTKNNKIRREKGRNRLKEMSGIVVGGRGQKSYKEGEEVGNVVRKVKSTSKAGGTESRDLVNHHRYP
jgi:hypothetical protein